MIDAYENLDFSEMSSKSVFHSEVDNFQIFTSSKIIGHL